jgi:dsRNA-specific ribonuclease
MKPEEHTRRQEELAGWHVVIETYKLGDVYHCTIANVDPGARIARADGSTREEAESRAVEKAARYLAQTRKFTT